MKYTLTFLALIFSCYIIQCFANPFDGLMDTQIKQDFSYNFPKPPEICDNGIDDDEDGYIDLFDTDCPCDIGSYQAACDNECFYTPQDNFSYDMELLWESERLTNLSIFSKLKKSTFFRMRTL